MKSIYGDIQITAFLVVIFWLFFANFIYSQDTICVFGVPILSDSLSNLPESSQLAMIEYESEMDEGVFIRQYSNDSVTFFYKEFKGNWRLSSLFISKGPGAVSFNSQGEIAVGMSIIEFLPVYQSIIESTGRQLVREFDIGRDVEKIPVLNIVLSEIVYFEKPTMVIHFEKGIVESILIIFIEEEY